MNKMITTINEWKKYNEQNDNHDSDIIIATDDNIKDIVREEMREQINKVKNFGQFLNENTTNGLTMMSGITRDKWDSVWKNKNLSDRLTNVTSDEDFAIDYSYNFKTGEYEDVYVEISNIPIEAFVSYREEDYTDDEDFHSMVNMNNEEKYKIIRDNSLFLVDLLPYKNIITTKLVEN